MTCARLMSRAALAAIALPLSALAAPDPLSTLAEQTQFQRTARYEEVERLCPAFQQRWPDQVRCQTFGRTPEGRPMLMLIASAKGEFDPQAARNAGRPVVLIHGGIHAGEVDGKDAGLLALRQLLDGSQSPGVLEQVTWVFIPVLNVDGHERMGRWNRPNQRGPEEMGWRTTAANLNLNRDYVKADAPEMQALLRLLNEWDPILYADLHVTNGAQFQHDISYSVAPTLVGHEPLRSVTNEALQDLMQRARAKGSLPLDFYPSLLRADDPTSGFAVEAGPRRFSHEYWASRNRIGVLVETHSWKDYPTRVRITHHTILSLLEMAARDGDKWLKAAAAADARATRIGGEPVALSYGNTDHFRTIDFLGYEYTRRPSAISGGLVTRYDEARPQVWKVPLYDELQPTVTVTAPRGGYIVPAGYAQVVAEKLKLHDIQFSIIDQPRSAMAVETFRAESAQLQKTTFEGRPVMRFTGEWRAESRDVPAGSLLIPINQARSALVMTLLEPEDPDSLGSWGYFATAFETKEYMDAYVAEQVGEQMLREDAQVREAFERRLAEDEKFARDPAARLEFFHRRHPSWDDRLNLYPVYRVP